MDRPVVSYKISLELCIHQKRHLMFELNDRYNTIAEMVGMSIDYKKRLDFMPLSRNRASFAKYLIMATLINALNTLYKYVVITVILHYETNRERGPKAIKRSGFFYIRLAQNVWFAHYVEKKSLGSFNYSKL